LTVNRESSPFSNRRVSKCRFDKPTTANSGIAIFLAIASVQPQRDNATVAIVEYYQKAMPYII
jgi:hypothetical protein